MEADVDRELEKLHYALVEHIETLRTWRSALNDFKKRSCITLSADYLSGHVDESALHAHRLPVAWHKQLNSDNGDVFRQQLIKTLDQVEIYCL